MNDDDSGPAFPVIVGQHALHGMTLRDYFAAKVLQGLLASGDAQMDIAPLSYRYADAMLVARNKT